ncbi:EP300-interacting inhibitor of differentiation 3 [Schistocerca americana]|uniref:EP300-interacting inhibitor of differentiation 3 n=1 Tax=Schistocerca americana TaxID=7009 RepID=UPI001F4FA020|nr:EP300-interacting inhibitor of differentiation 3 [Schistocerca americana]XP_047119638.1 EP300-interacting inhibitor of differentiation 3 [Schistocerca piceifrons]XP_049939644.1 EP300-interacting inhibitor of differentiation 3 isoform X1 [Schistocerca serialis cubense]
MNSEDPQNKKIMALTEERIQDIEKKKEVLEGLYCQAKECLTKADGGEFCAAEVMNLVEESQKIIESELKWNNTKVSLPLIDVKVLSTAVNTLKLNASSMDVDCRTFETLECSEKLLPFLEPGHMDSLFSYSEKCFSMTVPTFPFLYGTLNEEETQKVVRRQRPKPAENVESEKKRPENVTTLEKEETEIQKVLQRMIKVLHAESGKSKKPVSYFHFVVDPKSFSRTVENMFHVSFLVRDGVVLLTLDENNVPVLVPVSSSEIARREKTGITRKQLIIDITMDDWQYLIKEFDIQQPLFRPRTG